MIKLLFSKVPYYMPLLGILALTFVAFFTFSYDKSFQRAVVLAAGIAYVVWGIVYHTIHRDLSSVVILEYVAIAVLGVASILTII